MSHLVKALWDELWFVNMGYKNKIWLIDWLIEMLDILWSHFSCILTLMCYQSSALISETQVSVRFSTFLPICTANTAAVSSILGIIICFKGANRAFLTRNVTCFWPDASNGSYTELMTDGIPLLVSALIFGVTWKPNASSSTFQVTPNALSRHVVSIQIYVL